MSFINVGAYVGESRPASKRALREALASGAEVSFDTTSAFGPTEMITAPGFSDAVVAFTGSRRLVRGEKLSVVGPDPYSNRKWYATVEITAAGTVKVS